MENYRLHQIIASISVTIFILSAAVCIMVCNRSVYEKANSAYRNSREISTGTADDIALGQEDNMSEFESELSYKQLADSFTSFFKSDYKLVGYELGDANIEKLNRLKGYYRWAWLFAISSFIIGMRSFGILAKRRLYMPLVYGGAGSIVMTGIFTLIMALSSGGMSFQLKNMIFNEDYSYFSQGDILTSIIPPDYARRLFVFYIFAVMGLAIFMMLIRGIIIFCGRPHKF